MSSAVNPLYGIDGSVHDDDSSSSSSSAADSGAAPVLPPPLSASTLQTVNIRSHVPVVLDVAEPNHAEWRCFFDSVIGKFGLAAHVAVPPTRRQRRDQEWMMVDQCIVSWLYNSVSRDVLDFARAPDATAYEVWERIDDMFRDNQLHRAVYLEAEFRGLYQGDMSIGQNTARLKQLANALRDIGQPVSEPSQVLNLIRGLSPKYRHTVSALTAKTPPHTFLSARSYLLLEELYDKEQSKMASHHALVATANGSGRASTLAGQSGAPGKASSSSKKNKKLAPFRG